VVAVSSVGRQSTVGSLGRGRAGRSDGTERAAHVSAKSGNASVSVSWAAPASNGGSPVTGYAVRTFTAGGAQVGSTQLVSASSTKLVVSGLVNGTSYAFDVAALNAVGTGPSARTPLVMPLPSGVSTPSSPNKVTATAGTGTATVSWSVNGSTGGAPLTSFVITANLYAANGTTLVSTSKTTVPASVTRTTLTLPAGIWRFSVAAVNMAGRVRTRPRPHR
jgi:titin